MFIADTYEKDPEGSFYQNYIMKSYETLEARSITHTTYPEIINYARG